MEIRTIGVVLLLCLSLLSSAQSKRVIWEEVISPERLQTRINIFNEWFQKHTGNSKVEARLTRDVEWTRIGAFAKEAIPEGGVYLQLERSKLIKADLIYETKLGPMIKSLEETFGYDDYTNMVFYLLHEMSNKDSQWKPYLDLLPHQPTSVAFNYWARKTFIEEELANTPTLKKIVDYKLLLQKKASNYFHALVKNNTDLMDPAFFNEENLEWACMILDTRLVYIDYEAFLVPMLDFENFDSSQPVFKAKFDDAYEKAEIKARSAIRADEQIFRNIGFNNENYLLYHGIVLRDNQQDCYSISLSFSERNDDNLKANRASFFSRYFLFDKSGADQIDECLSLTAPYPRRLMFYFYTLLLDEIDLEKPDPKRFGLEEDRIVVDYVKTYLQNKLESYPTSIDHDTKREHSEPEIAKKNILRFQIEQKTFLAKLIETYHNQLLKLNKEDSL